MEEEEQHGLEPRSNNWHIRSEKEVARERRIPERSMIFILVDLDQSGGGCAEDTGL